MMFSSASGSAGPPGRPTAPTLEVVVTDEPHTRAQLSDVEYPAFPHRRAGDDQFDAPDVGRRRSDTIELGIEFLGGERHRSSMAADTHGLGTNCPCIRRPSGAHHGVTTFEKENTHARLGRVRVDVRQHPRDRRPHRHRSANATRDHVVGVHDATRRARGVGRPRSWWAGRRTSTG